jgi:hypothetical protein
VLPAIVGDLLHKKSFLFMGYSLRDWSIRRILTTLMRKRAEGQTMPDCAQMQAVSTSAEAYCKRRNRQILRTTVDDFADKIR